MGTETIPLRKAGQVIQKTWINNFQEVLSGSFIGRFSNGIVQNNYGRLGTSAYKWRRHFVFIGDGGAGDVLPWYDYNGDVLLPQGFMLCNGDVINQTNYDSQHLSGDWVKYISSSVLNGLYLPDMNGNFAMKTLSTLESGSAPITTYGSHTMNVAHAHTVSASAPSGGSFGFTLGAANRIAYTTAHYHSDGTTTSSLSSVQNKEPEHILVKFLMRII